MGVVGDPVLVNREAVALLVGCELSVVISALLLSLRVLGEEPTNAIKTQSPLTCKYLLSHGVLQVLRETVLVSIVHTSEGNLRKLQNPDLEVVPDSIAIVEGNAFSLNVEVEGDISLVELSGAVGVIVQLELNIA